MYSVYSSIKSRYMQSKNLYIILFEEHKINVKEDMEDTCIM